MKIVGIADFTLAVWSKEFNFRKKTEAAGLLADAGVDIIELGKVKNEKETALTVKSIAVNTGDAVLSMEAGSDKASVEAAYNCIKSAKNPMIKISLPVSTVQMQYAYLMKAEKMNALVGELCAYARSLGVAVEFEALDATRADENELVMFCKTAVDAGASIVTLCDDAGVSLPDEIGATVKTVKSEINAEVYVRVSNALKMAAACAVSAVTNGADGIKTAIGADRYLSPDVMSDIVRARGGDFGFEDSLNVGNVHHYVDMIEDKTPAVGEDGRIIAEASAIVLNSESTIEALTDAVASLGYEIDSSDVNELYTEFLRVAEKKTVGAKELEVLVAACTGQVASTYKLVNYTFTSGDSIGAMARVTVEYDGEILNGTADGDGPIDASFSAIENAIGHHFELDKFSVEAVTEGRGAIGSAIVRLRNDDKLYLGNGASTDIVGASIKAYMNALNKIAFELNK